jgi:O-antigen ligase
VAVDTNRKQKVFSLILAAIIMFAVLMMGTKKGLLIFGIGVIFCYLYKSKNFGSSLLRIVVICIAIGFAYYFLLNNYFLYEVIGKRIELMFGGLTGTATDASTRDRMLYIKDALEVFRQHEVFGVGLDGYRYVNSYSNAYSHNNYSEILADLGIIGFVIYYSMYVKLLSKAIQLLNKNILPLSIIIILMIIDYSSVSYSSELKGIWFALLLAFSKLQHVEEDNAV